MVPQTHFSSPQSPRPGLYSGLDDQPLPGTLDTRAIFDALGGNSGNLAFMAGIRRAIATPLPLARWGDASALARQGIALAVIPCANQFGNHYDMGSEAEQLRAAGTRVVAIGLGAQTPDLSVDAEPTEGTLRWVETMAALAPGNGPNIALRGHLTRRQLERFGLHARTVPIGCPSLFIDPEPDLGQRIAAGAERAWSRGCRRIAYLAGQPGWTHLVAVERALLALVREPDSMMVVQDPFAMFQLARGEGASIPPAEAAQLREHYLPHASPEAFAAFTGRHARLFADVASWLDAYRDIDLVIGPRIHGVILALQAGIPAICVAHDARTLELCDMMRIPCVLPHEVVSTPDVERLRQLFRFDAELFDANRASLAAAFHRFLTDNLLAPSAALGRLASAKPSAPMPRLRGSIDACSAHFIGGWAQWPDSPAPVWLWAIRNGETVAQAVADGLREDLRHLGDGRVGFSLHVPEPISAAELLAGTVQVCGRAADGTLLPLPLWDRLRTGLLTGACPAST